MDIYELEHAGSAVVSFGGQLPQNIALTLQQVGGANILGTNPLVRAFMLCILIRYAPANYLIGH